MSFLSQKYFHFCLLFIIFFLFFPKNCFAKIKPLDTYNNDPRTFAEDQKNRNEKAITGQMVIDNAGVTSNHFDVIPLIAADKIIDLCKITTIGEFQDEKTRNEQLKRCPEKTVVMDGVTNAIALLYANPPASGIAYTYDLMYNAGLLAQPAYAQGIGFSALSPFLPFWKVTRNISYMLLIVVMVAIGFMIIFRTKIDPKTVIGVQAALPKIVFTLILITFSYPIVGFMIDLMYLVMAIAISLMVSGMGGNLAGTGATELQSTYMTAGILDLFGAVFWPVVPVLGGLKSLLLGGTGIAAAIGIIVAFATSVPLTLLIAGIPFAIIIVIIALGLLFTFIRLFLLLANSYIQLLINLILGPILLLGEAIPGKSAFSNWFLNIIANLVVFPATAVVIMFSVWLASQGQQNTASWSPPFLGTVNPGGGMFHAFLGLAVIFMAPNLVATIKKAFHPKPVMPASVGSAFAPATGAIGAAMGAGQSLYYSAGMIGQVKSLFTQKTGGPSNKPVK